MINEKSKEIIRELFRFNIRTAVNASLILGELKPGEEIVYAPKSSPSYKVVLNLLNNLTELNSSLELVSNNNAYYLFNKTLANKLKQHKEIFIQGISNFKDDNKSVLPTWHYSLGKIFGFPECCINKYLEDEYLDNKALRPVKVACEHILCSDNCLESITQRKERFNFFQENFPNESLIFYLWTNDFPIISDNAGRPIDDIIETYFSENLPTYQLDELFDFSG